MNIIPSILEMGHEGLKHTLSFLSPFYHHFQIDIADGILVPNKTIQVPDLISLLPGLTGLTDSTDSTVFDFHLMVAHPEEHLKLIVQLPKECVKTIFIHKSVFSLPALQAAALQTGYTADTFGLVLDPKDEVSDIPLSLIQALPAIQLMTVIPGAQGNPFLPEVLHKIEQLKNRGFGGKIYIDGAINNETLPLIITLPHKPDVLCPGSFLAKSPIGDLTKRVNLLQTA